jgi:hypothetical protein
MEPTPFAGQYSINNDTNIDFFGKYSIRGNVKINTSMKTFFSHAYIKPTRIDKNIT